MLNFKESLKSINLIQLLFELIIVFLGVYMAFVFSSYQESRALAKESERVVALMMVGVERYEKLFEGFAQRHEIVNAQFRSDLEQNRIPDFSESYYPAPQYPIDVINFVLTKESYEVFALKVYIPLTGFANAIQRLMYVEEKLVAISEQYEPLPVTGDSDYQRIMNQQRLHAQRYLNYLETRKNISLELVDRSRELGELLRELAG